MGIGGKGNDGVAALVSQTEGAIGYPELQYAISGKLTYANVKNKKGTFITPCVATTSAAAVKTSFPPDLRTSLTWRGAASPTRSRPRRSRSSTRTRRTRARPRRS